MYGFKMRIIFIFSLFLLIACNPEEKTEQNFVSTVAQSFAASDIVSYRMDSFTKYCIDEISRGEKLKDLLVTKGFKDIRNRGTHFINDKQTTIILPLVNTPNGQKSLQCKILLINNKNEVDFAIKTLKKKYSNELVSSKIKGDIASFIIINGGKIKVIRFLKDPIVEGATSLIAYEDNVAGVKFN